jgi:hypothetical protein
MWIGRRRIDAILSDIVFLEKARAKHDALLSRHERMLHDVGSPECRAAAFADAAGTLQTVSDRTDNIGERVESQADQLADLKKQLAQTNGKPLDQRDAIDRISRYCFKLEEALRSHQHDKSGLAVLPQTFVHIDHS